jgi:hypothetical protein
MQQRDPAPGFAFPDIAEAYESLGHVLVRLVDAGYLDAEQRREIQEKVAGIVKAVEERRRA